MEFLNVFTAFSGYDSQCLALDRLAKNFPDQFGYELVGWSEIDKNAIKAHNAIYPQWADRNYGDISKIDWAQVPDFDLFTYSSPCQDFSQAGKQAGGEKGSGTRSSLLWECERAIVAKKPKYCVFENVAAIVGMKFRRMFNEWQLTLDRLGYSNYAAVLNARNFNIPQNRARVFLVSVYGGGKYEFPHSQTLTRRLKDCLEEVVDERYYVTEKRLQGMIKSTERERERGNTFAFKPVSIDGVAHTINTLAGSRKVDNYIFRP